MTAHSLTVTDANVPQAAAGEVGSVTITTLVSILMLV